MALQATIIKHGHTHTNAYHRVSVGFRDKIMKNQQIVVKVYPDKTYADSTPQDPLHIEKILVIADDFDSFLGTTKLQELNQDIEKSMYDFVKTIDPDAEGSIYGTVKTDYKNDSTNV